MCEILIFPLRTHGMELLWSALSMEHFDNLALVFEAQNDNKTAAEVCFSF